MAKNHKLPLDYIIVGILSNLPEDIETIPTAKPFLHSIFFRLRDKYPLLSKLTFDTSYYPYSEEIEQSFDNIELSSMICKYNPVLREYDLKKPELKNFFRTELESKLAPSKRNELLRISKDFAEFVRAF